MIIYLNYSLSIEMTVVYSEHSQPQNYSRKPGNLSLEVYS